MLNRLRRLMPTPESLAANRWLRWLGPSLLHPRLWHMSRRGIALGVAIGVFCAFIVPLAQIPLSAAASVALRANVPAAVAATFVNTPLTFGPVYYAAWRVGSWLLGEDATGRPPPLPGDASSTAPATAAGAAAAAAAQAADERSFLQRSADSLASVGKPLIVGAAVFAVGFGGLAYGLVNLVWHLRVRLKRRARLREMGSPPGA
jgi:uncharacterized protein (DUF2062 family)